jgi:phosphate transport system substrate-binding protein
VAETETEGGTPVAENPEEQFSEQARAAGIVLPKRRRFDPWTAVAIVVAVVLVTAGIGEVTGWISLRASPAPWSYETEKCTGSDVHATGTSAAVLGPSFEAWLVWVGQQMAGNVGSCFSLAVNGSAGDGYVPALGGSGSEFAATDAPPSAAEANALPASVVAVPVALGAVAVLYDLPGTPSGLNLSAAALVGIFNGSITSWGDPAIADANPGAALSDEPAITVFHDAAASSSTGILTQYLAAASSGWNASVGSGPTVHWPTGTAVASDAAMLSAVESTPGSVGYLELFGSAPTGVGLAHVEDVAGDFASPNALDIWFAADAYANSSAVSSANWTGFSLVGAPAPWSYPLSGVSFVGMYVDPGVAYGGSLSLTNATWLLGYVYWLTIEPAAAPLPIAYAAAAVNELNNETYDGTTIIHLDSELNETNEGTETNEF